MESVVTLVTNLNLSKIHLPGKRLQNNADIRKKVFLHFIDSF